MSRPETRIEFAEPKGRYELLAATDYTSGLLPGADIVVRLQRAQAAVALNSNFSVFTVLQFEGVLQNLGGNTRLWWTLRPGREFNLVWKRR